MSVMYEDVTVLIPAAGQGERLGLGHKAWLEIDGRPLLSWVAQKALALTTDVVVAVPASAVDRAQALCPDCRVTEGGETRQESIRRLLEMSRRDWVLLVDVVRPFASLALCRAVVEAARETGCAGAFLAPDVPVARIEGGRVLQDFERDQVAVFQAPQAFSRKLLLDVYERAAREHWQAQSTLQLVLRAGREVVAVPGEKHNIKITSPEDWHLAQSLARYLP